MRTLLIAAVTLFLLIPAPVLGQGSAKALVQNFYKDYDHQRGGSHEGSLGAFIISQKSRIEPHFYATLLAVSRHNQNDKVWFDVDPFINAQMNTASWHVGSEKAVAGGIVEVPFYASYRVVGPERLATTVQLRNIRGRWQIVNFIYPAEGGVKSWDLKSMMAGKPFQ